MGRSRRRRTIDACKKKFRFENPPPENDRVRPYFCENCRGYHTTSVTPKGRINWPRASALSSQQRENGE